MEEIKVHAKLLAESIPPLSSPAGGSPMVGSLAEGLRIDMNALAFKNAGQWPTERPGKSDNQQSERRWLHGDYKDAPYLLTHRLYERFAELAQ